MFRSTKRGLMRLLHNLQEVGPFLGGTKMFKFFTLCAAIGAALFMLADPAEAQVGELVIEEIIVTAQKREQALSDVGIAIDVVAGDLLRESGAASLIDVAQYSPGLSIRGPFGDFGYPIITLRGVNTDGFIETLPQSTGVYVDGVYLSQPPMLAFRLLDIERMEVLKGPQGTIYGRNTIAGAVSFVSKRPTFEPEGYVTGTIGNYSRASIEAAYGGPLSDTVAARGALRVVKQTDSPVTNLNPNLGDGGEIDQVTGRLSLLFRPSDNVDFLVQAYSGKDSSDVWPFAIIPGGADTDNDGIPDVMCDEFANGDVAGAQVNCLARDPFVSGDTFNDTSGDPYTNDLNAIGQHDNRSTGIMAELIWNFDKTSLTSVTGWDDFERSDPVDEDAGPTGALDNVRKSDVTQFSQEVRLASDTESRVQWITGLYYSTDKLEGSPSINQGGRQDFNKLDTDTLGVFGQIDFAMRDNLSLIAGLRFTSVDRSFFYRTNAGSAPPNLQAGDSDSFSDSDWSGRLALEWRSSEQTLIYGSLSRGFNAGTYNSQFLNDITPTDSESILAYEIGAKTRLANSRVSVEAAAFYYDYADLQVVAVTPRGNIDANVLTNADSATLSGFEFQVRALPTDWLDLSLGVSYVDSEYGNLVVRVSGTGVGSAPPYDAPVFGTTDIQIAGNPFPNTPEWSINASGRVNFPLGDDWRMYGNVDFSWDDDIPRDLQGTPILFTKSHSNVDARFGIESEDGKWNANLWARNLTDELYITEAYQVLGFGFYVAGANFSYPRTYGLSVSRNF